MTATQDTQALRRHFVENFRDDLTIVYTNSPPAQIAERAVWCRFSVRLGETFHVSGSSENGILVSQGRVWLQVFVPANRGDRDALEIIDQFAAIFRHVRLDENKIKLSTPDIDVNPVLTDGYMMATVSVPYESFRRYD